MSSLRAHCSFFFFFFNFPYFRPKSKIRLVWNRFLNHVVLLQTTAAWLQTGRSRQKQLILEDASPCPACRQNSSVRGLLKPAYNTIPYSGQLQPEGKTCFSPVLLSYWGQTGCVWAFNEASGYSLNFNLISGE